MESQRIGCPLNPTIQFSAATAALRRNLLSLHVRIPNTDRGMAAPPYSANNAATLSPRGARSAFTAFAHAATCRISFGPIVVRRCGEAARCRFYDSWRVLVHCRRMLVFQRVRGRKWQSWTQTQIVNSSSDDGTHDRCSDVDRKPSWCRARDGDSAPTREKGEQPRTEIPGGVEARLRQGAMTEISTATVRPIKTGANCAVGPPRFRSSVTAKTTRARISVPSVSARNAPHSETTAFKRV